MIADSDRCYEKKNLKSEAEEFKLQGKTNSKWTVTASAFQVRHMKK